MMSLGLIALLVAAGPPLLEPEMESRTMRCGGFSPDVTITVVRYKKQDDLETLEELHGQAAAPGFIVPKHKVLGCMYELPPPSAEWTLKPVRTWVRKHDGAYHSGAERAALVCTKPKPLRPMETPTAIVPRPGAACAEGDDEYRFIGGERRTVTAVTCKLTKGTQTLLWLTFVKEAIVERVEVDSDCYPGRDFRFTPRG